MYWKKSKALAMIANRRQWFREFDPSETSETEILSGEGYGIVIESSISSNPTYIEIE
jgi:hypothetical protein